MRLSGFTFVRQGVTFDFPFLESVESLVPICDEVVVAVGRSQDDTRAQLEKLAKQHATIRLIDTIWDEALVRGGQVLAAETNKALRECRGRWCLYLQADEVLHEADYPAIRTALKQVETQKDAEGVIFPYLHFYGNYRTVNRSPSTYRQEVRLVQNRMDIFSYRDAQGFRKYPNEKLKVIRTNARIFHYGYVRPPRAMQEKLEFSHSLYHGGKPPKDQIFPHSFPAIVGLEPFLETHPAVMKERIARFESLYPAKPVRKAPVSLKSLSTWTRYLCSRYLNWLPGEYRNFKELQ
jgi:glycosyltransferase involved in cell wall biosynthesis